MLHLIIEFVSPSATLSVGADGRQSAQLWSADANPADSEAIVARNEHIARTLMAALPGLASAKDQREDLMEVCADDGLSQEQVLRRFHRVRAWMGPWRNGELSLEVYDQVAYLYAPASAQDALHRTDYTNALATLIDLIATTTEMTPRLPDGNPGFAAMDVASAVVSKHAAALTRMAKRDRMDRWRQQLGLPSLIAFAALTLIGTLLLAWVGIQRGTLMAGVDPNAPSTFLAQSAPAPHYRLGVFPKFALHGRIAESGEAIELPVYRDQFLRAGPGAPFTVLRTADPRSPYVLRTDFENASPVVRIGAIGLAWHTWLAFAPPALFYAWVLRPLQRGPAGQRQRRLGEVTAKFKFVLLLAAVAVAVTLIKRFF